MIPGDEHLVAVTVTNATARALPKVDYVLSYRWTLADRTNRTRPGNRVDTPLPVTSRRASRSRSTPRSSRRYRRDLGSQRRAFVLNWDLRNRTTGKFLSESDGVAPLKQNVTAEPPTSNQLGLEKFYQYNGISAGAGLAGRREPAAVRIAT